MNFWEKVDFECEKKEISRKELAYRAGIAMSNISAGIVRGGVPRADIAIKVANILGLPLEYFFPEITSPLNKSIDLLNKYNDIIVDLESLPSEKQQLIAKMIHAAV